MTPQVFETEVAGKKLVVEVGRLAKQAGGSCTVRYGDTVVLAAATMGGVREGIDFFPLSVDYEERLYAAGKIKGSRWIKREGRPSDEAVLTGRLIDRCIRPLFPKEIKNDVQVIVTALSFDGENDPDVVGLIAASIALSISNIPWNGPLAGARIGRINEEWVLNPSFVAREKSDLDLVIAAMDEKVLMIEAEGKEVVESVVYDAIDFSLKHIKKVQSFISEIAAACGATKLKIEELTVTGDSETADAQKEMAEKTATWLNEHVPGVLFDKGLVSKDSRRAAMSKLKTELLAYLETQNIGKDRRKKALSLFEAFIEREVTRAILEDGKRVDGRSVTDIRPLSASVGILPRTHGTALFNRGDTQVLSIVTLGSPGDEQFLEGLEESSRKRFMHHYNFPPYSVGETGRLGSPGRREIGHGALAEKAVRGLMPTKEAFPYTVRVVSEVFGSNGSSSMASVCGSSMALMDAGVPLPKPLAGIAMGLASDEAAGKYKVLTDLQDLEDGPGGMDFKIAGTADGITAIQLDTKTKGLPMDVVKQTLTQAKDARLEILSVMAGAIPTPRPELSQYAPRIVSFNINPEKIRDVIGPGGKVINKIIDETGVQIDIEQDGLVLVTAVDAEAAQKAVEWIKNIVREVQIGETFTGKVTRMFDFGAMVEILPGQEGMVHISEMAHRRVDKVSDVVKSGDTVNVKVVDIDEKGRVNLSIKALLPRPEGLPESDNHDRGPRRPSGPRNHKRF